jgi:accessory colonization factor AcfC
MDAFQEGRTYAGESRLVTEGVIIQETRTSLYERGSGILVRPGNPLNIQKFEDLAKPGVRILVVQGAGQTGMWEDMASFAGLVPEIRANIFVIAGDGADAIQKWNTVSTLDAWITYESWGYRLPDTTDLITVKEKLKVYRGTPIAITNSTDERETAQAFLQFLLTSEAHEIFIRWGWR